MKEIINFFSQIFNESTDSTPLTEEEIQWHIRDIEESHLYPLY